VFSDPDVDQVALPQGLDKDLAALTFTPKFFNRFYFSLMALNTQLDMMSALNPSAEPSFK
jgi:hypothetical protein